MTKSFSDGIQTEWDMRLAPLWFCFLWICVAPFVSLYRVGPLSSFYLETGSLLGAAALVLVTAYSGLFKVHLSSASVCFLILAAFWWVQARVLNLTYPGMSDMVVWTFIIIASAAWACRAWVAQYGQERIVTVFAWALLIGALIQATVSIMQFSGLAGAGIFKGIIAFGGSNNISGQLGQRNHLGHYLMWGVAAASYLWAIRRVPNWLGALLLLSLTLTLGLVNSRTIFTYVVGIGVILPFWRWRAGRESSRIVSILLLAVTLTAVVQFAIGPILDLLSDTHYETAVERAENSGFEGSARQTEWIKAWIAFKSAPLLGHGWNSYSSQNFLINADQHNYVNNILSVLFTHSHNIIMQLLAETGIIGTALVIVCYIVAIWRLFRRPHHASSLFLLALMAVTLCHSMLEYPLWYIYFLVPFGLMISLTPAHYSDQVEPSNIKRCNLAAGLIALCLIGGMLHLTWTYTNLVDYSRQSNKDFQSDVQNKIKGLRDIAENSPMMRYYAHMGLTRRADPTDPDIKPWAEEAAMQALTYRPFANTHQVGLYLYRRGKTAEGSAWMQKTYYYYPYLMSFYAGRIRSNPVFKPLLPTVLTECKAFRVSPQHSKAKACE